MKQITILLLSLLLISTVSAITVYSGEPITLQLEEQFEYYTIAGNETEVILNVTQYENNSVTIIPDKYMSNDTFEISFFNSPEQTPSDPGSSSGGGGGGGTRTVYKDNIVPIDNYVTQYVDKEVEVEKEVEVIVEENGLSEWWIIIPTFLFVITFISCLYLLSRDGHTDVRRLNE